MTSMNNDQSKKRKNVQRTPRQKKSALTSAQTEKYAQQNDYLTPEKQNNTE